MEMASEVDDDLEASLIEYKKWDDDHDVCQTIYYHIMYNFFPAWDV